MPEVSACPTRAQYEQLASGQLAPADKEALLQHLENCMVCAFGMESLLAEDTLVELVRQAGTHPGAPPGEKVIRLVERLSKQGPGTISMFLPAAAVSTTDPEQYDFLAPALAPDELGRLGPYRVLKVLG